MFGTTRAELATALDSVAGIAGYERRPDALRPGDAWPILSQVTRGPGYAWQATWRVLVVLGPAETDAVDQLDQLLPELLAGLQVAAHVDSAQPVALTTDAGPMMALELTARTE